MAKPKRQLYGKQLAKRQAMQLSLQALYQWHLSGNSLAQVELNLRSSLPDENLSGNEDPAKLLRKADITYFLKVFHGAAKAASDLEAAFSQFLDRPVSELDPIELAILRLASYELSHCLETPYRVVINEAVELAKLYGATASHKYINGVLDQLAQQVRAAEIAAKRKQ